MYDAFIVNPVAGNGFTLETMQKLEQILRERKCSWQVFHTQGPGNATEIAKKLAGDPEVRAVISVGGDGTAFEVASGLAGTGKPMGIIPAGTGNDFMKSAGIPKDPAAALELILEGKAAPADMGRLNEGRFLNVCGTGFDVTVLDNAEKLKSRYRGLTPYFLGLLKAIFHYQPVQLKLKIDGQEEEGEYLICSIANGRYIGGGIPICPEADVHDGMLDLILVQNVPRRRIPLYLPGLMMGKVLRFGITRHQRVREISISGQDLRINVDGEIFTRSDASFAADPASLILIHQR